MFRQNLILMTGTLLLATAIASTAGATPEANCQTRRLSAAGSYARCQEAALANLGGLGNFARLSTAMAKCSQAYTNKWANLQTLFPSTSCAAARFVDNGDGSVTDSLTGLQWEQKDDRDHVLNPANPHDSDNTFGFSANGTAANGSVFTAFLSKLNGSCFANQCDWRLPTLAELLTILDPDLGQCAANNGPCLDHIFGPTHSAPFWSATAVAGSSNLVWLAQFRDGSVLSSGKTASFYARAVRGGL